jgi:hypothetical protein
MPAGRKSLRDEINVIQRYAELAPKYFKFISQMLDDDAPKDDKKWAAERLDKAFPKMIPQDINADLGGNLTISWQQSQSLTPQGNGSSDSTNQQNAGLSSSSTGEQVKQLPSSTTFSGTAFSHQTPDSLS